MFFYCFSYRYSYSFSYCFFLIIILLYRLKRRGRNYAGASEEAEDKEPHLFQNSEEHGESHRKYDHQQEDELRSEE